MDLTQQRPDLDVRGLPWARRIRRRNGLPEEDRFEDEPETVVGRSWGLFRRALRDVVDDFRGGGLGRRRLRLGRRRVVIEEEDDDDGAATANRHGGVGTSDVVL